MNPLRHRGYNRHQTTPMRKEADAAHTIVEFADAAMVERYVVTILTAQAVVATRRNLPTFLTLARADANYGDFLRNHIC
jgi:hypothetical protein